MAQLLTNMKANSPYYYVKRGHRARQLQNIEQESWLVLHNPHIWEEQPESNVNFDNETFEQTRKRLGEQKVCVNLRRTRKLLGPVSEREDDIITNTLPIRTFVISLPLSHFRSRTCVVNHNALTTWQCILTSRDTFLPWTQIILTKGKIHVSFKNI